MHYINVINVNSLHSSVSDFSSKPNFIFQCKSDEASTEWHIFHDNIKVCALMWRPFLLSVSWHFTGVGGVETLGEANTHFALRILFSNCLWKCLMKEMHSAYLWGPEDPQSSAEKHNVSQGSFNFSCRSGFQWASRIVWRFQSLHLHHILEKSPWASSSLTDSTPGKAVSFPQWEKSSSPC